MSERQRQTAFLKSLISFGETPDYRDLLDRIHNAERDENSVRRKIGGLILLVALSAIGMGYTKLFVPDHFLYTWRLLIKCFSALGLGAVIGLVLFTACWCWCRAMLNGLRDEARRLVQPLLEARLQVEGLGNPTQPDGVTLKPEFKGSDTEIHLKAA